jgi:flagellar motor component MotA
LKKKTLDAVSELNKEVRKKGVISSESDPSEELIYSLADDFWEEVERQTRNDKIIKKIKKLLKKLE